MREIDELYDVYLDVKQRWKIEVGCHMCVTKRALVLSHWPHYLLFRAENLKPIDNASPPGFEYLFGVTSLSSPHFIQ